MSNLAPDLTGHEQVTKTLFSLDPRQAKSIMLEGPRGIGKAELARVYAARVLGTTFERLESGGHPDYFLLQRKFDEKADKFKREIGIDEAREMHGFLTHTPAESKFRVVIIDAADELRHEAANSILKMVEEPPKNSVIILLSHGGYILPTIYSRCLRFKLNGLEPRAMEHTLRRLIPEISHEDLHQLSELTNGSVGSGKEVYENDGLWIIGELAEIMQNFPKTDYVQLMKFSERVAKNEKGWEVFSLIYSWLLARLARNAAVGHGLEINGINIGGHVNVALLLDVISEWERMHADTNTYNLDHKQVITSNLTSLANCFTAH